MTPPGSSGTPSRPATTRLLVLPALSRAAQAARRSAAACTTVSGSWAMFPLRLVNLAWTSIVPGVDSAEEALTMLLAGEKGVCEDRNVAPRTAEGVGADLTAIEDDELDRVGPGADRDVAPAADAALDARGDLAVEEVHL